MDIDVKNRQINKLKVTNGEMKCVGDVFTITGDFEIEFKDNKTNSSEDK